MEKRKTIELEYLKKMLSDVISEAYMQTDGEEISIVLSGEEHPEGLTVEQQAIYSECRRRLDQLAVETQANPPRNLNDHIKLFCDQANIIFDMLTIQDPERNTAVERKIFVNRFAFNILKAVAEINEEEGSGEELQADSPAAPINEAIPKALAPELIAAINAPLNFDISVDKVSIDLDNLFLLLCDDKKLLPGQLKFSEYEGFADMTKNTRGSKKLPVQQKALVYYGLDFTEAMKDSKVSRGLTAYDLRINTAIDALFIAGNTILTAQAIYNAAGWEGNCGNKDRLKILESVRKMAKTWLVLNNKIEHDKYNNMKEFTYEGNFLQAEIVTAKVNGIVTNDAIIVKERAAVMRFSATRNHIYNYDIKLLRTPLSKTDKNLRIENYLQTQIAMMKKGVRDNHKILFDTLYDACNLKKKQRYDDTRYKEKVNIILEYYKKIGFIKAFKIEAEGIIITL